MKIGLEVHVALPLKSKLFCRCSSAAEDPNSAVCPICMGFPGSKPMLNEKALSVAKSIAGALNCKIGERISFVRKVYFYPDLPKSFQITQTDKAVGHSGYVQAGGKRIGITRVQIEEDPARIIREGDYTLLDFNRSGIGLVEIVTEPDMSNETEMRDFLVELRSILYYLGVDIEQELKVDLNVSLSTKRVEVKNVTGISNITNALRHEIKRQEGLLSKKLDVRKETRSYNEQEMKTVASREKETEEEYGFIYEPDLTDYEMRNVSAVKPVYASRFAADRAAKYKYSEDTIRELVMFNRQALALIEMEEGRHKMQNIVSAVQLLIKYGRMDIDAKGFEALLRLVEEGVLVSKESMEKLAKGEEIKGYSKVDEKEVNKEIVAIIRSNLKLLEDYKKDRKVLNFVIGKVSKKYGVDPRLVSEQLAKVLKKEFKVE